MRLKSSKLIALLLAVALVASMLIGCAQQGAEEPEAPTTGTETEAPALKAAMVTDVGGLGDKSFNDLSWAGLQAAESELGAEIKVLESKQMTDYESNLSQLASAGFSPIFAVGFLMTDSVTKVAAETPDTYFGGIDIYVEEPPANYVGISFKENEAGYLAGVVAGLATMSDFDDRLNKDNTIGFVGGMEIPPVQKFEAGFIAGAKAVNPDIKVVSKYVGKFDDQAGGKEAGLSLISGGADIVFAAAGQTGLGTFAACKESGKALFIGVDADQYNTLTEPGDTILTSAVKRVDVAVLDIVKKAASGDFPGGENLTYGLAADGVGLAPFHDFEDKVSQEIKDAVDKAIADIKAGTVTVPETK